MFRRFGGHARAAGFTLASDDVAALLKVLPAQMQISMIASTYQRMGKADVGSYLGGRLAAMDGAWVLHMLRGLLGDSTFFTGIRRYYAAHVNGNALTADLQHAMEAASGRPLDWFFHQWLYEPGYPRLHFMEKKYSHDETNWWVPNAACSAAMPEEKAMAPAPFSSRAIVSSSASSVGLPCRV